MTMWRKPPSSWSGAIVSFFTLMELLKGLAGMEKYMERSDC